MVEMNKARPIFGAEKNEISKSVNKRSDAHLNSDTAETDTQNESDEVYNGAYPLEQLNLVRDSLRKNFVNASCRCRAEFMLKLKLGIINDEIIDYFKHGKIPEGLPEDFEELSNKNFTYGKCILGKPVSLFSSLN